MKKLFIRSFFFFALLFIWSAASSQTKTVTGTVMDARSQEIIAGASVEIVNFKGGTRTEDNGIFSLNVPQNATQLSVSAVGYEVQVVTIPASLQLTVMLVSKDTSLQDVVVVAYGRQKKATVTGAMATITTRDLVQSPVSNLTNALAGRLPGLITTQRGGEPGVDASTLYIRGISTLGTATPIIMVDGVERSMDYLDPNDVESLTILKEAAATAVLGMRGANGAVLITTKRGKSGAPTVSFRTSFGFQEPTRLPEYLGSYDYARLRNEALINDGAEPSFDEDQLEAYRLGLLPNTDYYDFFMKPSGVQQGNLNISGGTESVRYFISAGFNRQEGNYKFTKDNPDSYDANNIMKRYNFRANVDVDINPTLTARLDLAGILTARTDGNNSAGTIMNLANRMAPIYPIFNEDGSLWGNGTFTQNIYGELSQKGYRIWYNNTLQGTFSLTRKLDFITRNLSARVAFSYDNTNSPNTGYGRNYAVFQPRLNALGQTIGYNQFGNNTEINPNGSFSGGDALRNTYLEATMNWNRTFKQHELTGLFLYNRRLVERNAFIPQAYESYMFRGTYNYRSKYLAEISASYQGSENFPKESRYGLFPSASIGWVLSEENFIRDNINVLSFLKLRASYGEVGNDRSGDSWNINNRFLWFTSWAGADPYYFGTNAQQANGWAQGSAGNAGVTWERGRIANVGIEARFLQDKFSITADFFKQRRSQILTSRNTLTDVFGQGIKQQNIGIVDNKGFEVEITHRNRLGDFYYEISPNFSYARNNVVYQDEVPRAYPWMTRTGHPVGTRFGLIAEGFFMDQADVDNSPRQNFSNYGPGDIKYRKLTGHEYDYIQQSFDEAAIGYGRTPEIMFGSLVRVGYKGLDFSVLLQGAAHSTVMLNNEAVYEFFQEGKVKPFHLGRWTPATAATATYPRLHINTNGNNHRASTFWLRSADYVRIKNAEIGYQLPDQWVRSIGLSYFRIYSNAMNMFTWDKLGDYQVDPEIGDGNGAMYPIQKIYSFGIDVRF